jgi:hypothetical protein
MHSATHIHRNLQAGALGNKKEPHQPIDLVYQSINQLVFSQLVCVAPQTAVFFELLVSRN